VGLGLILEFAKRDFTERYSGSALGMWWSLIWPVVHIFIYVFVFSKIMGARLPGTSAVYSYSVYLVSGLVPWMAFSNTIGRITTVFLDKKPVLTKMHVPLPRFPLYVVISESVTCAMTLAVFIGVLLVSGFGLGRALLLLPVVYAVQQVFAYGLGFFLGILNVFLRDLKEVVQIGLQLWFWFTPIVYVSDILPRPAQALLNLNPAFVFVDAYHQIFLYGRVPEMGGLYVMVLVGHGLTAAAYMAFKRLEKDVRDFL